MVTPNRICPQCGNTLHSDEELCSHCGRPSVEPLTEEPVEFTSLPDQDSSNPSLPQMRPAQAPPARFAPILQLKRARLISWITAGILLLLVLTGTGFFLFNRNGNTPAVTGAATVTAGLAGLRPSFSDSFADNSKGWATGSGTKYSSIIGNNQMSLSEANHKIIKEPIPGKNYTPAAFSDFAITTTFSILKADQNDSIGLYLRGNENLNEGYFVDIFGDSTYDIVKVFPDSSQDKFLISPTSSPVINSLGQQNKLTVVMKGSSIVILINGKLVNSITDSTYTSGEIALFAENGRTSSGVNAVFNSVVVYPAPGKLPG